MKIKLLAVGKTDEAWIQEGLEKYMSRLKHYIPFEQILLPDFKAGSKPDPLKQKTEEGKFILQKINAGDHLILLDENGKEHTSEEFSSYLQKKMNGGADLVFVIGGPFGFSEEVYKRSNEKLSLSRMTFSHQMVRVFFVEQLYRGLTILRGEKYHHK